MSGTDLPQKISDEEGRALAFTVARALPRIVSRNAEGVQTFDAPMLAQCLREAGYRREVDVRAEVAATLRSAAAGRREYADGMSTLVIVDPADLLTVLNQRNGHHYHERPGVWDADNRPEIAGQPCVECAARERLRAALATALEQAQPLLAAGSEVESLEPVESPKCTCPLIDVSSTPTKPEFVLGDPAGCKVHGQERDAQIEAAKRRARG